MLNGSSVPILEVVKCMKSNANRIDAIVAMDVLENNLLAMPYMSGIINTPNKAPGSLHTNGDIPNSLINNAIVFVSNSG